MEVISGIKNNNTKFGNLKCGEVFRYSNSVYYKTGLSVEKTNAVAFDTVDMSDTLTRVFENQEMVEACPNAVLLPDGLRESDDYL